MSAHPALYPLSVGELLEAAIYVYRKSFVTLMGIGAVIAVPLLLFLGALGFLDVPGNPFSRPQLTPLEPPLAASESPLVYIAITLATALLGAIAGVFQIGAIAFAVSERRIGRDVTIGSAYRQALRRSSALLGSTILVLSFDGACFGLILGPFLIALVGSMAASGNTGPSTGATTLSCYSLLLSLPALAAFVYITVRWSLIVPAIMLENLGALKGMGRSWRLVKGSFWRTLAILLVVSVSVNLLMSIVSWGVQFSASALLGNSPVFMTIAISAAGLAIACVLQPVLYVVGTLLYYDLRVRHGRYDLQIGLDQLKQPAPPAL